MVGGIKAIRLLTMYYLLCCRGRTWKGTYLPIQGKTRYVYLSVSEDNAHLAKTMPNIEQRSNLGPYISLNLESAPTNINY